jgi:hypothetical protein
VFGDLKMKARNDPDFPSDKSFSGLGPKQEWASKVVAYCREQEGFEDVFRFVG